MRIADKIAYVNHDTDDAVRAGVIREEEIPQLVREVIGTSHGQRVDSIVQDVIRSSRDSEVITMSTEMAAAEDAFVEFLYDRVYRNPVAKGEEEKVLDLMEMLFRYYVKHPDVLPPETLKVSHEEGLERAVCDYIAGMTDSFAVSMVEQLFVPAAWNRF